MFHKRHSTAYDEIEAACAVNTGGMYTDSWTRMERAIRVKFTLAN